MPTLRICMEMVRTIVPLAILVIQIAIYIQVY